jgi:hypothetical protein
MAGHNLPDSQTLPFVDDSVDTSAQCSSSMETVFKCINGASFGRQESTFHDKSIHCVQPLENSSNSGWL